MTDERDRSYWVNRTLCDVLYDLKKYTETSNLAVRPRNVIFSLVQEAQILGNRMEAGLGDKKDLLLLNEEWHKLRREVKDLRKERDRLKELDKPKKDIGE